MPMRLWDSLTWMERYAWEDENRPFKLNSNKQIRRFSGDKNRIPGAQNIRGYVKRHKREGHYLFARQLQHESRKLQRHLDKAEVEQQLLDLKPNRFELLHETEQECLDALSYDLQTNWEELDFTSDSIIDMSEDWNDWDWRPQQPEPVVQIPPTRWYYTHEGD